MLFVIEAYKEANEYLNLKEQTTIIGDSIEVLKNPTLLKNEIGNNKFSLIFL